MISESNIVATVKYGKYISHRGLINLYLLLITSIILMITTIASIIFALVGLMVLDRENIVTIIIIDIFALFLMSIAIGLLLYHKRNIKEIQKWLKDAIVLKAKVQRLDLLFPTFRPYQVSVRFKYNGKEKEQTQKRTSHREQKQNF